MCLTFIINEASCCIYIFIYSCRLILVLHKLTRLANAVYAYVCCAFSVSTLREVGLYRVSDHGIVVYSYVCCTFSVSTLREVGLYRVSDHGIVAV